MAGELQGIGPYRLLGVIGEGERAVVYRAVLGDGSADDRPVAVKVLRSFLEDEAAVSDDLKARVDVGRALSHDNILASSAYGEADGRPYAVTQLCEGISLEDLPIRKKSGRLKPEPALAVLHGLLNGLAAACGTEDGPFIHGTLDAGDVLLGDEGEVRLAGLGVPGDPQTDLRAVAGLAEDLCRQWPMRVDAWIDRLKDGEDAFPDAQAALDEFPMDTFPEGVLASGGTVLARAVRRVLKKRVAESEAEAEPQPSITEIEEVHTPVELDPRTLFQANAVAWACAAVVLLAVTLEIITFGP
ncbi:MAG: protein kinase [Myxococcota bacterium]|nr:protein kinase [Myxococcota bacterium]MEE2779446.1 protein kinase [Myxococcota bacterium]